MMDQIRRDELEQALLALDDQAMVLEELDGFIAGLLVSPEVVPVGEWFAAAFGMTGGPSSVFVSIDHANEMLGEVTAYYDHLAFQLGQQPARYQPLFPIDERNGDVLWELWMDGFAQAMDLRRAAWTKLLDAGGQAAAAAALFKLADFARNEHELPQDEVDRLIREAPELITQAVATLSAHRANKPGPAPAFLAQPNPFASRKIGRNEPCPCGSGQKYKRCCGAA